MRHHHYTPGDWNAICFECGMTFRASEMVKHWQGYYVCREHWEPRHPQDYVRPVQPEQPPPWVQPRPPIRGAVLMCDTLDAIADEAIADCAIADYIIAE